MWPFGKSRTQRENEAAFVAKEVTKAALDMYVPDGLLRRGVLEDFYILGYVVRRMNLAAVAACRSNKVPESCAAAIAEWLLAEFFDDITRVTITQRLDNTRRESLEGEDIGRGMDAATRLFNYWVGHKDIKTDPHYQEAVEVSRFSSKNTLDMPDITSIVHTLEYLTFYKYFSERIGHPSLSAVLDATRPRFPPTENSGYVS